MSQKLRDWMATPAEARTAWIVAAACVVLIVTAFVRPFVVDEKNTAANEVKEERHTISVESRMDEKKQSASIEKIIAKAQQEEPEAATAKPQPAPVPEAEKPIAVKAASPVKPAPVKPAPVTSTTTITASTDTAAVAAILANAEYKRTSKSLPRGYYVQLGAFSKKSGAEALQKKLSARLDNTHVQKKANGMYAVWTGPYASSKESGKAKSDIAKRTGIQGFTVKY